MTTPEFMPVLAKGAHERPEDGACLMEYVSILAGEKFSDHPGCTHPVLATVARNVNDRLEDGERHLLVPLIGRLFGTAETGSPEERQVLSVRLAVWSARRVFGAVRPEDKTACEAAIVAAEKWADNPSRENAYAARDAAKAEFVKRSDGATYAAAYASAAAELAIASVTTAAAELAIASAAAAADAADAAAAAEDASRGAAGGIAFLTGLIDEHDRLTGRTESHSLTPVEQSLLMAATA